MIYSFAVYNAEQWSPVHHAGTSLTSIVDSYARSFRQIAPFREPRAIVFHDFDSATKVFSNHPLPAWTNGEIIHVDPLVEDWRRIFISAIAQAPETGASCDIPRYYASLDVYDVATIVGHEITHHLDLFEETFVHTDHDVTWFEEGLCFYLPRKLLLSPERWNRLNQTEASLVRMHAAQCAHHPTWQFRNPDDSSGLVDALFDYWRATAVVRIIIDEYTGGDVSRVLELFQRWMREIRGAESWFDYLTGSLNIAGEEKHRLAFWQGE